MGSLVGYLRVSTETQAEEGLGLDVQRDAIERWAAQHGHRLVAWHCDEGISGSKDVEHRAGLSGALAAVEDGAEGIVAYRLDRIARALTVQEAVLAQVWRSGGAMFTVDLGEVLRDDPDDPMRTAMRQMVGVFAQLERGMIAARMRAGRKLKHARGGYAGFGSPPFGRRSTGDELVADEAEAETVERIVHLRHDAGCSLRQICEVLEFEGRPAKRGERWHPKTVARVLARAGVNEPRRVEAA